MTSGGRRRRPLTVASDVTAAAESLAAFFSVSRCGPFPSSPHDKYDVVVVGAEAGDAFSSRSGCLSDATCSILGRVKEKEQEGGREREREEEEAEEGGRPGSAGRPE